MNHVRNPVFHSPFQFGQCAHHATHRYEVVCLECGVMLCELCLLVGNHAELSDHPIVSTIEAFRMSLSPTQDTSPWNRIFERKQSMIASLKSLHSRIVQAESNHVQIQSHLDRQLRSILEQLERIKRKRIDYVGALRRETLLLLTLVEWFEAFLVHARLALPPSLWLVFFHRVHTGKELVFGNSFETVPPIESVEAYLKTLPHWGRVEVDGFVEVYTGDDRPIARLEKLGKKFISNFQWLPTTQQKEEENRAANVSPSELRMNRMSDRMDQILTAPQGDIFSDPADLPIPPIPLCPIPESLRNAQSVPLDNIKDFVMQTLAVLSHSENALRNGETMREESQTKAAVVPTPPSPQLPPALSTPVISTSSPLPPPTSNSIQHLRDILRGGIEPYSNAVAVVMSAPGSERQDLIRLFAALVVDEFAEFVQAVCREAAAKIDASSFLVSGMSLLVPLTACFTSWFFPKDAGFLDNHLRARTLPVESNSPEEAEVSVCQLLANGLNGIEFPDSVRFLLRCVYDACAPRFGGNVALGVTSGLFLARILAPRLLWVAPKSSDNIQAPPIVTLMARFIHRAASAAAEGNQTLLRSNEQHQINTSTCVTHANAIVSRAVVSEKPPPCPSPNTVLSPKSAANKIETRIKEYGHGILYA
jgi:hypothetical protein